MGTFEVLPVPTKLLMCLLMVAGRLEVMTFPVVAGPELLAGIALDWRMVECL